jgi:CSLREA domain-containing protein
MIDNEIKRRLIRKKAAHALLAFSLSGAAMAATQVNSIADPGDGVCDETECTLREAIAGVLPGDEITFMAGLELEGPIALTSYLDIVGTGSLTINGPGMTVKATNSDLLVFNITEVGGVKSDVSLMGLTINGTIVNSGQKVTMRGVNITPVNGVAVYNNNGGLMEISDSTISGANSNTSGGAIWNYFSTLNIHETLIHSNKAYVGAGLFQSGESSTTTMKNVTVSDNTATGAGGGLWVEGGTVDIVNSTITNNHTPGDSGGIAVNNASPRVTLKNSIVAGNTAGSSNSNDCSGKSREVSPPNLVSNGNNLFGDNTGCTSSVASDIPPTSDITSVIAPLADNGGSTLTHALQVDSPAIDAGGATATPLLIDQRGFIRPIGSQVDIGAFEANSHPFDLPPTANAGVNQTIHAGSTVVLNGAGSYDDNTPTGSLGYAWNFVDKPVGSNATLVNADTATPSFVADLPGSYSISLVVTDGYLADSDPAVVVISSENQVPVAAATASPTVQFVGSAVSLNGSASLDPDTDPMTFSWAITNKPALSSAVISNSLSAIASFVPDQPGTYQATLTVSDHIGSGAPVVTTFTATAVVVPSSAESKIITAINLVNGLPLNQVTNKGNRKDLANILRKAIRNLQNANYCKAVEKLDQAIERTDGCPLRSKPDTKNKTRDWITSCTAQIAVYNNLFAARGLLANEPCQPHEIGEVDEDHEDEDHDH